MRRCTACGHARFCVGRWPVQVQVLRPQAAGRAVGLGQSLAQRRAEAAVDRTVRAGYAGLPTALSARLRRQRGREDVPVNVGPLRPCRAVAGAVHRGGGMR